MSNDSNNNTADEPKRRLVDAKAIAARLSVSPRHVLALAHAKAIPSVLVGRKSRRFDPVAVMEALERGS